MSKKPTIDLSAREVPPAPEDRLAGRLPDDLKDQKVREQLLCTELLSADDLKNAQNEAKQLYEKLIQDTVQLMNYGKSAVANLNAHIREAQDQVEPVEIDELHQDIKRVTNNMEGLSVQYNPEDPKVVEKIQREVSGKKGLFNRGPSILKRLEIDRSNTEQLIDGVAAKILEKVELVLKNIALDDHLFQQNEEELLNLIYVIAVMEIIRDLAKAEIKELENNPGKQSTHEAETRKRLLTSFAHNMTIKITEYKNRMFIGRTSSQQIMHRRDANVMLLLKLDNQNELIVPMMRKAVFDWSQLIETMKASNLTGDLDQTANKWFERSAQAGAELLPEVYEQGSKPSINAETISKVAEYVAQQSESLAQVMREVQERQKDAGDAMVKAQRLMQESSDHITDAAVDEVIQSAKSRLSM